MRKSVMMFFITAVFLSAMATPSVRADGTRVTIIYSNTITAQVVPVGCGASKAGGLARRSTVIREARQGGDDILVVDAGNLLFPANIDPSLPLSPKKETVRHAQLLIDCFNRMGCDAVAIGAGELRLGVKDFIALQRKAQFPFLSANVTLLSDRQGVGVPSSVIKIAGGLRWGIFSLMSATPSSSVKIPVWKIADPVSAGKQVLKEFEETTDVRILLAAMPLSELKTLLPQLPGVTFAVTYNDLAGLVRPFQVGQTIVVSCPRYGRAVGMLHLSLRDPRAPFIDEARVKTLERELAGQEKKGGQGMTISDKKTRAAMKKELLTLRQDNTYRHEHVMLTSEVQEDPGVQQLIDAFKAALQQRGDGCL
jgi:2',3'-cyclic-nucleotide 2'-phosphodiesterase (5'-nucleotidase family)